MVRQQLPDGQVSGGCATARLCVCAFVRRAVPWESCGLEKDMFFDCNWGASMPKHNMVIAAKLLCSFPAAPRRLSKKRQRLTKAGGNSKRAKATEAAEKVEACRSTGAGDVSHGRGEGRWRACVLAE